MINNVSGMKNVKRKNIFIASILLFFIVFNPPIIRGLSFTIFAIVFSLYVYVNNKGSKIPVTITTKLFCVFLVYCISISVVGFVIYGDISLRNGINTCIDMICSLLVGLGIAIWLKRKNFEFSHVLDIYIWVGVIQAILSILCFVFPVIKEFLNSLVVNNSGSDALLVSFEVNNFRRNYGFASTLYDIFGCTMSLLSVVALIKTINNNRKYAIAFLLIAFSAIINARTSIVLIGVGSIVVLMQLGRKRIPQKSIYKSVGLMVSGLIIVLFLLNVISNGTSNNSEWLMAGINEIVDLLHGKRSGTFDALFNTMFYFPQNVTGVIFGTGINPEQSVIGINSDVGYIRNIWQFGLVGSILEYGAYISLFKRAAIVVDDEYIPLFRAWTIMIFLYLIKLNCFGYSMAATVFLPILFYAIYSNNS